MYRTERPRKVTANGLNTLVLQRDRTVTMWSCTRQQWERGTPSDSDLRDCDHVTADRIKRHSRTFRAKAWMS